MLVSTALVFFMMPGLALFYGGMVRAKNVLNMFMQVMICVPLITVEWVAYGYNMAGGYAFVCTLILGLLIDKTIGFTVGKEVESHGLDIAEHGESAYHLT